MIGRMLLGVTAVLVGMAPGAVAQEAPRQGWWTTANVAGAIPSSVSGPDVPADGLLVQGGASDDEPTAVAALAISVPAGADVRSLTVHADASAANVPGSVIMACPLQSADFVPAQGGPISQVPAYDCTNAAIAVAGADGITYSFPAAGLITNGVVAVALVPGNTETRVALSKPGDDVLGVASPRGPPGNEPSAAPSAAPSVFPTPGPGGTSLPAAPVSNRPVGGTPLPRVASVPDAAAAPAFSTPASFGFPAPPRPHTLAVLAAALLVSSTAYAWRRSARMSAVQR